ncbi:MAG: cytidine deaminase [Mucinivorans sp.]
MIIEKIIEKNLHTKKMDPLLQMAKEAAQQAYAPYSSFKVGAAVECTCGQIVTGNNQEVSSYSLTLCAERVALAKLFSDNPAARVARLAIYSPSAPGGVVRPCGACRQYIAECAQRSGTDIEIVMADKKELISTLLPLAFSLK